MDATVSLSWETAIRRIRSALCILRLSLPRIENMSTEKWQKAANCTSLILLAINFARPLMSALVEEVLKCSI